MGDDRGRLKSERRFYVANVPIRCTICHRWFIKRRDGICPDCKRKAAEQRAAAKLMNR